MRGRIARIATVALLAAGLAACDGRTSASEPASAPVSTASSSSVEGPASSQSPTSDATQGTPGVATGGVDATTSPGPMRKVFAIPRTARLEPGPQTGYRFSTAGAIVARRALRVVNAPMSVTVDRRRTVPTRAGLYLRVSTGDLAGYEVRESPVAYLIGIAGSTSYATPLSVTMPVGRYLTYRFDGSWRLASTHTGLVRTATTASADRRAVINGRAYLSMSSGEWSGWWMPITRPLGAQAQPITCAVAAKPPAGASQVLTRVPTNRPRLALTLDMGGRLDPALKIINRLVIDRVCVTVHPTGATALTPEGTAVMKRIAAHPELFEVGNHTMYHCNLVAGGEGANCPVDPPTTTRIQAELTRAEKVIRDLTGWEPAPFWRPPYGAYDTHARTAAAAVGYTKTLMWDVDTIDWKRTVDGGPTAASMQDKVLANATRGSIVLMHLGGYHTYDALPGMVLRLRQADLIPTTVSHLIAG